MGGMGGRKRRNTIKRLWVGGWMQGGREEGRGPISDIDPNWKGRALLLLRH